MDSKSIISNVLTAVGTAIVMALIMGAAGLFQKGTDASIKEVIREVLNEEMQTDSGETYGQALTKIGVDINSVQTQVGVLQGDVRELRNNVLTLAGASN